MRLTNDHKQAFVYAVMDDAPKPDFSSEFEKIVKDDMMKLAPKELQVFLKSPSLAPYVLNGYDQAAVPTTKVDNKYYYNCELGIAGVAVYRGYEMSEAAAKQATSLAFRAIASFEAMAALKAQVSGAIESCTTLKAAHERLPEFAKYLPPEAGKSTMLPAIANLTAELTKAGWPKELAAA